MSNQVDPFDDFEKSIKTNVRRGIVAWAVIALSGVAVVVAGIVGYVATDSVKTALLAAAIVLVVAVVIVVTMLVKLARAGMAAVFGDTRRP